MGSEIDIGSSFWKRYFDNEEDARKIDIFDLINASITVASSKKPDEFRSRRFQIMKSLFTIDSSRPIVKNPSKSKTNQEPIIIQGCEDQACKDEIVESHKKFDNLLERELDECAQPIGFHNDVNMPADKKRKAEVSKICRSETNIEADRKRKVKETNGQGEDMNFKFEGGDQQIEKAQRRVKILDGKEIAPSPRLSRDSKAEKGSSLIVKNHSKINQEPITIQGCRDEACKDEIFDPWHKKYDDLEKELNEYAQPIGFKKVSVRADKKRKAEVSKICRSGTKLEADMKRRVEETSRKVGMDPYEHKFEVSKTRFEERNQQIEKAKRKVQILDRKKIAPPPRLGRDDKPKGGFGSRMKKVQQARF